MVNLVRLGYQAGMDVTAVMEPKVTRVHQGVLGPRDLQVLMGLLESMERTVLKGNLESRVPLGLKGSPVRCLTRTGKSAYGKTLMMTKTAVWLG